MTKKLVNVVKCPHCTSELTISLGMSYAAEGIYRRYRCKHCGQMFKTFVSEYAYAEPSKRTKK